MKLTDRYDGRESPFEGDRTLVWRSLPDNAWVTKASVKLRPASGPAGELFEEVITFTNGQGVWGATKTAGTGFIEVDFHKRRTPARVMGTGAAGAHLQVDLGSGVYVEINDKGAIRAPNDKLFSVPVDGKLPGLLVTKFKLTTPVTTPPTTTSPNVSQVTIRSVPTNVSMRLGNLPPFWTYLGELPGESASPDFAAVLQAFLTEAKVENGFYQIPLTVHSDTITRLQIALEIEYQIETSVMPPGLDEVQLPYDFGSLPKAQENVLQLAVPENMRVVPGGVTARVRGTFEETRIAYGPTGAVTPAGTVEISPAISQAQIISLPEALTATAFDLFMVVTQTAKLQLDLREDLDGKPGNVSLLPGPVKFEVSAPAGTTHDRKTAGDVRWVSVVSPAEFQFQKDQRYWLVLQCLEGQTAWNATPAGARMVGMQHTKDGGLSWRDTTATGISGAVSAFFRLRQKPDRFETPIELQVGSGEQAIRVSLDRFQPLGRVDFELDFEEVAQAFNEYLDNTSPVACPETEHLINGDFEQWLRVGEKLGVPTAIPLRGSVSPTVVAISPDGRLAYVGADDVMQLVDIVCNTVLDETFDISGIPNALVFHPAGGRAYLLGFDRLQVINTDTHKILGGTLSLKGGANAVALSSDGGLLYVTEYFSDTAAVNNKGFVRTIDTVKLEEAVIKGAPQLEDVTTGAPIPLEEQEPTALAVSPNGRHLYVTISKGSVDNGLVQVFDTTTLKDAAVPKPIGSHEVGQVPSAIALSPDGKVALIANKGSDTISMIDTVRGTVVGLPITVGNNPIAVAISPDGGRVYVANSGSNALGLSVIDLSRRAAEPINVNAPQTALALTPQGDRIYIIITDGDNNALTSIQIGTRVPVEWNLTSGWVTPLCLPDPFHLIVVLGVRPELRGQGMNASLSALSQGVPVVESCSYQFSFWGISTEADAVAEVLWLGAECGLLRTDQVPIEVVERQTKAATSLVLTQASIPVAQRPVLRLHRVRLMAPPGAKQAEVRFNVPEGVTAGIDRVSLIATNEAVANADFSLQQEGRLAGWNLLSSTVSSVTLVAVEDGIQIRNAGAETAELVQTIPVKGDQPFTLEFRGRVITQPSAKDNPRIVVRWFKLDQSPVGAPLVLEVAPSGLNSAVASGVSLADTSVAEMRFTVPPGTWLEIKRVSLRFSAATSVPVTFIAQASGELTVSNWRVTLERVEAAAPQIPENGLCAPTLSSCQPGERPSDRCFCSCCETERTMTDTTLMVTQANRPALVGRCATCGVELVRFSGARVSGAPSFSFRLLPAQRPVVLASLTMTRAATAAGEQSKARAAVMTPLTAIPGIGEARARRLAEVGIDTIHKLVAARPEDVARALKRSGVSEKHAAGFIERAKQRLASWEKS